MTRPQEHDFISHVAYTRALEEYCDFLEQEIDELYNDHGEGMV